MFKRVKICFIITGLNIGGAEIMLFNLLERIDTRKFSACVISLMGVGRVGPRIAALGIPVESLDMSRGVPDPIRFLRLVQRIRQIKPNVIHTWMYHADLIGGLAGWVARIPAIIWGVRGADFLRTDVTFSGRVVITCCTRMSSWLPTCVLYNSQKGRLQHEEWGYSRSRSVLIQNGVDLEKFKPNEKDRFEVRRELGIASNAPLIGLIARFDPIKNHEGFIKMAASLHRVMPEVHFLMAGQGVEHSNLSLRNMIENANLSDVCHLLGRRDDIARITAALDLAGLTSWSESFPNVLVEAMACGVPCVSTDAGDAPVIVGEAGWIVSPGDMEGFAAKCAAFLDLPEAERRLFGERARARAMRFEIGAMVKRYETLYLDIVESHPRTVLN